MVHEELWRRLRETGDPAARDSLIESYLWLVRYVAGRLMVGLPGHFDQGDVEGHGCFGLLDAVAKFDPDRGVRFETFAIPWIRGACLQGVRALQWAPALRKRVIQLEQAQATLESSLGREPSVEELADALTVTAAEVEKRIAEAGCLSILSLEESLNDPEGEGGRLADRLVATDAEDPVEAAQRAERQEVLAAAIDSLPSQERMVIALFYHEGLIAREISELLGLSAARISQIHSRAILRLRGKLARTKNLLVS